MREWHRGVAYRPYARVIGVAWIRHKRGDLSSKYDGGLDVFVNLFGWSWHIGYRNRKPAPDAAGA